MLTRLRLAQTAAKKLTSQLMVILLGVALLGFLALFLWQSLQIQKMQAEYQSKKAELAAVQSRVSELQDHLDFYKGPGYLLYVEAVARNALGLVKPGETLVVPLPDGSRTASNATSVAAAPVKATAPPAPPQKPNWQNWLGFFFGS